MTADKRYVWVRVLALSAVLMLALTADAQGLLRGRRGRAAAVADTSSVSASSSSLAADSLGTDSLAMPALPADSLAADTASREDIIDAPVAYESTDSMVWTKGGNAYLYGGSKVNYQNIELTAQTIIVNIDKTEVYAEGLKDSLGNESGRPVFKEGSTPYESDTMSYNFKT